MRTLWNWILGLFTRYPSHVSDEMPERYEDARTPAFEGAKQALRDRHGAASYAPGGFPTGGL